MIPDVSALDRTFDYAVPEGFAPLVSVGVVVRVELKGRRVRGWVEAVDVSPEADPSALLALAKISSAGPTPELVELSAWAARRWAGPRAPFLRTATPPNAVPPAEGPSGSRSSRRDTRPAGDSEVESLAALARGELRSVVRWPPTARMAELLRRLVGEEGSTIVVVPDVRRAEMLVRHLEGSGHAVAPFYAEQSAAERTRAWARARLGGCVVVGGRVAAWAPVPDLTVAVVVDEEDEALKEERAPTWHARDVLVERAARTGARVTVVTPVPSLEVLEVADRVLEPSRRRERSGWGAVGIVDRRGDPPGSGLFSPELVGPLRQAAAEGTAVCVLNRKGRARLLACDGCGGVVTCERCDAAVIEDEGGLACRRCESRRPRVCARCGSTRLRRLRPGISRLREELEALVPRGTVAEVEARTERLPRAQVLVGTEAVLHRISGASLVAFLDFDQELLAPRFRASEQALWLLVRALRCVGPRSDGLGVLVQTRHPDHEVVRAARAADPHIVALAERERRAALDLPPFAALARASGSQASIANLIDAVRGGESAEVMGPVISDGGYQALVRARDHERLAEALALARAVVAGGDWPRVEVDPLRA